VGNIGAAASQSTDVADQQLVVTQLTTQVQEKSGVSLDKKRPTCAVPARLPARRGHHENDQMLDTLINNTAWRPLNGELSDAISESMLYDLPREPGESR